MKHVLLYILLLLFFVNANAQKAKDTLYVSTYKNDSLRVVFIDTPNSVFHQKVFDLVFQDSIVKHSSYGTTNKKSTIKKFSFSKYTTLWVNINKYKGKFYAYFPSEAYFNTLILITDSTIIVNEFNDGLVTYLITNVSAKKNKITFKMVNGFNVKHTLQITEKENGVFEISSSLYNNKKLLFVNKEAYVKLPIIVNYCPNYRCEEFVFEK